MSCLQTYLVRSILRDFHALHSITTLTNLFPNATQFHYFTFISLTAHANLFHRTQGYMLCYSDTISELKM